MHEIAKVAILGSDQACCARYREWDKELGSGWKRTLWLFLGRMELHLKSLLPIDKTGKGRNLINVWDFL